MNKAERENWIRVKESMEAENATDNMYYRRAVAISEGKPDPLDTLKFIESDTEE